MTEKVNAKWAAGRLPTKHRLPLVVSLSNDQLIYWARGPINSSNSLAEPGPPVHRFIAV